MQAFHWSMIGLVLDIVGGFFVSAEAIKLQNLRALRDRLFRRIHERTLSPQFYFGQDDAPPKAVPSNRYPGLFLGLHYVAGLLVLAAANFLTNGWPYRMFIQSCVWWLDQPWYWEAIILVAFVLLGVFMGIWLLGECVHVLLEQGTRLPVMLLDWIDARAPNGTVGIIGFVLLFLGFVLQILGTYAGRSMGLRVS